MNFSKRITSALIPLICASCISFSAIGQYQTHNKGETQTFLSPGVSYQGQFFGEFNIMKFKYLYLPHAAIIHYGPRLGMEINMNPAHFIYAPKLGYEGFINFLVGRINTLTYIDKGKVDWRVLPEVGISYLGKINLTYGYGIPLLPFQTGEISPHRVTLIANIWINPPKY